MSGYLTFSSRTNDDHNDQTKQNIMSIIETLPFFIRIIVKPLASIILNYVLKVDENYTVDVADRRLSDSEAYVILKSLGAQMEKLRSSNLASYFDNSRCTFKRTIQGAGDLNTYINDIVDFCASYANGHINTTALKNVLSTVLKSEMVEERSRIDRTETIVVYSTRTNECGVMRVTFSGDQIKTTNCCSSSANTSIDVERSIIMFRNTQDLLAMLRTFVQANQ